ncbi:MAG: 2Fe-2S iron-sulfur cluster-binding protein [Hyphomicrobium sp.]|uniref:2Fe-2S iron-sulfur cluster-binding protein n=1 Tax=Hyphomicrobium sp. TaxID=82 RepID=UPI0039E25791
MTRRHQITINGKAFRARSGELLLDAALSNGIDLPHDCRSGHCGTCCVRLVQGDVEGGEGSEPSIVHACQCRVVADAVFESDKAPDVRAVDGLVSSLRPLSADVIEVGIRTSRALPFHAGQYTQIRFSGYPSRPYSFTLPLHSNPDGRSVWFHIRRMKGGRVSSSLGKRIKTGHRVQLTGPYGSAYFRNETRGRMVLVATNTGFAPIWSIAVAALRENPERRMMIIAGGRSVESLYMGPALSRLAQFPNVLVVAACSAPEIVPGVMQGRPTDFLPRLLPSDVLYACGAPEMVNSVKSFAAHAGATCHADPFMPTIEGNTGAGVVSRVIGLLAAPIARQAKPSAFDHAGDRREQILRA